MLDTGITEGERLCALLRRKFIGPASWPDVEDGISFIGTASQWSQSFQEMLAVNLTGRIVAGGKSLADECAISGEDFENLFERFVGDTISITGRDLPELLRFAKRAVTAARLDISPGQAKRLKDFAFNSHPRCYMCGEMLLFAEPPAPAPRYTVYTAEHIWPQSYGGDSIDENILPACRSCNNEKKQGFATWVMTDFQSLNLGIRPSAGALARLSGQHKFALHYKAAQRRARMRKCSLKQAFLDIGPWTDTSIIDDDDAGHFFNLQNHNVDRLEA